SLPPDGARVASCGNLRDSFARNEMVRIGAGRLVLSDGTCLALSPRARRWSPEPRFRPVDPDVLFSTARQVVDSLLRTPPHGDPMVPIVLARALPSFDCLIQALATGRPETVVAETLRLTGLGPGVTPLGDDLLVGCCLGLTVLGRTSRQPNRWLALRALVAETAAPRTTARSAAWLRHAGRGEFARELVAFGRALTTPNRRWVERSLQRVLAIGSSSGWSAAYGASRSSALLLELTDGHPARSPG
ncbi:MAG: DUF2877 domain-containing protein, partial [Thermomicrobium sp.]|nr:DUF2877 domain-containing protein [Thermomicrobium sp.]